MTKQVATQDQTNPHTVIGAADPDTPQLISLGGHAYAHPDLQAWITDDLDSISPHPRNPRNGDTDAIAESIRTTGMYRPIFIQASTGLILAGNHTYAAALELGATRLPIVRLNVDDQAALRILVADNQINALGNTDDALLLDVLGDLNAAETGLLGTGFTDYALLDIINRVQNFGAQAAGFLDGFGTTTVTDLEPTVVGQTPGGTTLYQVAYTCTADQRDTIREGVKNAQHAWSTPDNRISGAEALCRIVAAHAPDD